MNKKVKITLIVCASALFISTICFGVYFALSLAPGSYPNAQGYTLKYSESDVINAINTFKENNPQYKVLITDGRRDSKEYWYHAYFFLLIENKVIHSWTRPRNEGETEFALVAMSDGFLGKWKCVNKDYEYSENQLVIHMFEERILKPITFILQNNYKRKNGA